MEINIEESHGRYAGTGVTDIDDKKIHLKLQLFIFERNFTKTFRDLNALLNSFIVVFEYKI